MRFYISVLILLLLNIATFAYAEKIPNEVMEPYKQYLDAAKASDKEAAARYAKKAWMAAEDSLGDHKTTGDLAINYALTDNSSLKRDRRQAFERAVELAELSDEPGPLMLERQIQFIEAVGATYKNKDFLREIQNGIFIAKKYNLEEHTFFGELMILRGVYRTRDGSDASALKDIDLGISIIENANDGLVSAYPYMGKLYRADVLRNDNKDLEAALAYQEVMQNVEGDLPVEHPYVKRAFGEWMSLRFEFEEKGTLENAEQAGLCQCWPFEEMKKRLQPLKRTPPVMPRSASRSGHANVLFDLNEDGKPVNISIINSTEPKFEKPSMEAVENWVYSAADEESNPADRKDIAVKITYQLVDRSGNIIPEK